MRLYGITADVGRGPSSAQNDVCADAQRRAEDVGAGPTSDCFLGLEPRIGAWQCCDVLLQALHGSLRISPQLVELVPGVVGELLPPGLLPRLGRRLSRRLGRSRGDKPLACSNAANADHLPGAGIALVLNRHDSVPRNGFASSDQRLPHTAGTE